MVFAQGDIGDRYYVIESGEADVVGDGRVVAALGPGEGFGEMGAMVTQLAQSGLDIADSAGI